LFNVTLEEKTFTSRYVKCLPNPKSLIVMCKGIEGAERPHMAAVQCEWGPSGQSQEPMNCLRTNVSCLIKPSIQVLLSKCSLQCQCPSWHRASWALHRIYESDNARILANAVMTKRCIKLEEEGN